MLGYLFNGTNIFAAQNGIFDQRHFFLKSCGKNSESHYFDEADVFLLDVMVFCVRMVDAHRMLVCRDVVSEYEIQLEKTIFVFSCDRCDRVVGNTVSFREDECIFISVRFPLVKYHAGAVSKTLNVIALKSYYRHRPIDDAGVKIFKSGDGKCFPVDGTCHREGIATALEMIVA